MTGEALFYATIAGGVATLVSLATLAWTSYTNTFSARKPDLEVSLYEVRFHDIHLTCRPHDGDGYVETFYPHTNGNPPGKIVRVRGSVYNAGTLAGNIEFIAGHLLLPSLDPEVITSPLAGFEALAEAATVFTEPGATTPFSFDASVEQISSDGYLFGAIEFPFPPSRAPIDHGQLTVRLSYFRFEEGRIILDGTQSVVPATIVSPAVTPWTVVGPQEDFGLYACKPLELGDKLEAPIIVVPDLGVPFEPIPN